MQRKTITVNQQELFRDLPEWAELQHREDSFKMYWEMLDEFGKGFMYLIKFRPGLMLGIGNYYFRENIRMVSEAKRSSFGIDFTLSGSLACTFNYRSGGKDVYNYDPKQSCISYLPEYRCIARFMSRIPVRIMGICLEPCLLKALMEEQYDYIPTGMRDIMAGNNERRYYHPLTTTIAIKTVAHEIFNCPYQGNLKRLWLEGKTLELIAHSLAQLDINKNRHDRVVRLQSRDIESIWNAKDILTRDMGNPPSLLQLAGMVGINKNKLNQGFREIFGTSVFDYLRICRLERGRELLKSGEKNVTEVALEVGYAQQSNFTKAFKKHFGTNPTNYLR